MPKIDWPPEDEDITHLIERLDALEDREGIRFESLWALFFIDPNGPHFVRICGEVHPHEGLEITHHLKVAATLYDSKARVLNTASHYLSAPEKFYGFEAFQIDLNAASGPVTKIRLYPQRA